MRRLAKLSVLAAVAAALASASPTSVAQERDGADLFRQMATVMQHPRCMNCHTAAGFPRQGADRHRHTMNVMRGPADHGAAGLHCATCHQSANQAASGVPGAPDWHLAPLRMAWEGLGVAELCRALRDPKRGGMRPAQLVAHFGTGLVRWAWSPGLDHTGRPRAVPPIGHDQFIDVTRDWVSAGAPCPN
jgi:hypothetical protein